MAEGLVEGCPACPQFGVAPFTRLGAYHRGGETMQTLTFLATLDSDTVISESSSTAGVHSSLDYLPGACLLGACAAAIYKDLSPAESFLVFHSGKVRFGNAYPMTESGVPAIPVPAAWHCFKGESPSKDGMLTTSIINQINYKMTKEDEEKQPKQMRDGYFTLCGLAPRVETGYRLKTAVDRKSKKAAESQLFGYEHLSAGSRWWFELNCDADVVPRLVQKIQTALLGSIRLGRSRTAEFGRATVVAADGAFGLSQSLGNSNRITLYCLSDLALRDGGSGALTLIPDGSHFGLTGVVLDKMRSFIRTRSYAPFNGTRCANDLERQVISKGSVITFVKCDNQPFDGAEIAVLQKRLSCGTGLYLQDGLGRLLLNPAFLDGDRFVAGGTLRLASPVIKSQNVAYTSELTEWLAAKSTDATGDKEIVAQVEKWAGILKNAIRNLAKVDLPYPGNSQWGTVRSVSGTRAQIESLLFCETKGEEGFCVHGVSKAQWDAEFRHDNNWVTFAGFLKNVVLAKYTDDASAKKALQLLGNRMPRILNQMKGGE